MQTSRVVLSTVALTLWGCATTSKINPRPVTKGQERLSMFGSVNRAHSGDENGADSKLSRAMEDNSLTRVEKSVWRTSLPASTTFQLVTRILSQSYIIDEADKRGMTITTDWDKFFIDGRLFRNRIAATVFPLSSRSTEIVFKNSVEYYSGGKDKADSLNDSNWLPTQDVTDELPRIVDALARQSSEWARVQGIRSH